MKLDDDTYATIVKRLLGTSSLLSAWDAPRAGPDRFGWRADLLERVREHWIELGQPVDWSPEELTADLERGVDAFQTWLGVV